jgi:hypothetical protein
VGDELPIACLGTAVVVEVELGGLLPGSHHKYVHAGHEVSCHKVPMPRGRDSDVPPASALVVLPLCGEPPQVLCHGEQRTGSLAPL